MKIKSMLNGDVGQASPSALGQVDGKEYLEGEAEVVSIASDERATKRMKVRKVGHSDYVVELPADHFANVNDATNFSSKLPVKQVKMR